MGTSMTMWKRRAYVIILAILLAVSFGGVPLSAKPSSRLPDMNVSYVQTGDNIIQGLISSLLSKEDNVRQEAERRLIDVARTSSQHRSEVILALLKSVRGIDELDGNHDVLKTSFLYWRSATNIFAALKATEAINVLIQCVHCSNGYTGTMGEPPASIALIQMGAVAVPKLSEGLQRDPDGFKRVKIALCLGRIGGTEASLALKRALRREREKAVRDAIRFILASMAGEPRMRSR